jgi:hypothetical protein
VPLFRSLGIGLVQGITVQLRFKMPGKSPWITGKLYSITIRKGFYSNACEAKQSKLILKRKSSIIVVSGITE